LLTNNPKKVIGLEAYGLKVMETVPIVTLHNPYNRHYMETKQKKLGHHLATPRATIKTSEKLHKRRG